MSFKVYSHYKGGETIKFVYGITPCGCICYVSKAYGGRTSDKEIFNQSKMIKKLEPTRDALMIDKGFDIEDVCRNNYIQLYVPKKKNGTNKFSREAVRNTSSIASARVNVERAIQRIKVFKILIEFNNILILF